MGVVAMVLLAANAFAQAKPDFSGTWTRDPAAAPANNGPGGPQGGGGGQGRGGGGGFWGAECTITQTATKLTVKYMGGGQTPAPIELNYNLDGTDSKNMQAGRGGAAPTEVVSKVAWVGNNIVITTPGPNGDVKLTVSKEGAKMKLDRSAPGRDGGAAQTSSATYSKKM
jgi:hypothetical protein